MLLVIVSGSLKQAIYAAGQGALAAVKIQEYLGDDIKLRT